MSEPTESLLPGPICSLLLFLATSAEEKALEEAAQEYGVEFRKDAALTRHLRFFGLSQDAWRLGTIGGETVVAIGASRDNGRAVMGAHGRLGSAAKAVRCLAATGAQGILQIGMAFGIAPGVQQIGDVLVSALLLPYDNRDVKPNAGRPGYVNDYMHMNSDEPRPSLLERCRREKERTRFSFNIHIGAMLSGAARIHCAAYRDELLHSVPHGNEEIVGGEMEGVGLLAASLKPDDSVWCVVKGISDFADEQRDNVIKEGRKIAPINAARFVLSGLVNDAKMLAEGKVA
ncbi:5'-methylthioadenosine/S-adenosylhomocysteine nucleosidase family protein [Singulisphaera acidiphila]|uniref:Nucleoside phosphorylase n=1 Tax=Singulisphaera acidiphila (strain ATCC BAA-1392 / DSM 18658 / VKM B-2454 / MOB10) TaxID=886293 RepID=L0DG42_SINAD|nr:nucleoside phosphorylase [Singulisphaera acidiphila]AGA28232.1 nucleoside phosphorylase [Singulisphaera acidiphila DSM 18658]